jgi:hypothetical protein
VELTQITDKAAGALVGESSTETNHTFTETSWTPYLHASEAI